MKTPTTPAQTLARARRAASTGNELLMMGASVGAIGLAGAAFGAVCPLCVVATPALLSLGVVQKIRGLVLSRASTSPAEETP